ncbi:MAG: hypothetical protein M1830_000244 [Pleopsidium flavum]|nr:MAG: hypothetical protein M1830_000244 [Pleopsidium flavum]
MTTLLLRVSARSPFSPVAGCGIIFVRNKSSISTDTPQKTSDPRLAELGRAIEDEYATLRDNYETPKNPIVLAHGLLGFDELHLAGKFLPGVHYWRGITEVLASKGIEVITASVPSSASIEQRATKLGQDINKKAGGKSVNIVAWVIRIVWGTSNFARSGGKSVNADELIRGLDSRYMISQLKPPDVKVLSLTTIASPHRGQYRSTGYRLQLTNIVGSAFADFCFDRIGTERLPRIYKALEFLRMETGAFSQLTRKYMREEFNPKTPDREGIRYYSYGATVEPSFWSVFRQSHRIVEREEGPNDGLVSVASSQWGSYKGTLVGVSHLDLINWTNRLRWLVWELTGNKRK